MTTIAEFKRRYNTLASVVEREQFLLWAKGNYQDSATPELRKFLNKCIKEFNEEVARTNSYAGKPLHELKSIFDTFTTTAEMRQFILDIKGIYGATKNVELRKFLNECTRTHNAIIEEHGADFEVPPADGDAEYVQHPEDASSAAHAENTDYEQQADFSENALQAARAQYMEQAAQAVQSAHTEEPQHPQEETEQAPEQPTDQ